jgi:hypothetical protein
MTLLSILRLFFMLLSLILLGIAAYLLWTWYQGHLVRQPDGALHLVRDQWRLWTGLPLLAWSFLGRYVITFLLARRDEDPTHPNWGHGRLAEGRDGATLYVEALGPADAPSLILTPAGHWTAPYGSMPSETSLSNSASLCGIFRG